MPPHRAGVGRGLLGRRPPRRPANSIPGRCANRPGC